MANKLNAREQLEAASMWLGYHNEDINFGLKSPEDALKLWRYANAHPEMDEMADTWTPKQRKAAIGYDPLDGETRSGV